MIKSLLGYYWSALDGRKALIRVLFADGALGGRGDGGGLPQDPFEV